MARQASHLRRPASEIADLISLANCFPQGADVPDLMRLVTELITSVPNRLDELETEWQRVLTKLPKRVKQFLGRDSDRAVVFERLDDIRLARGVFRALAARNADKSDTYPPVLVRLTVDEQGALEVSGGRALQILRGLDAARIRECQVCFKIFWAGRLDQHCCNKRCAGAFRTRKWRERYLGKYKQKRILKIAERR